MLQEKFPFSYGCFKLLENGFLSSENPMNMERVPVVVFVLRLKLYWPKSFCVLGALSCCKIQQRFHRSDLFIRIFSHL